MASDQERAEFYLTRWRKLMRSENPLCDITWYAGGAVENESMVVSHLRTLQDSMLAASPKTHHRIFTNCRDIDGWQDSYVFDFEFPGDSGHTYAKGVNAAVVGCMEDGFSPDLYMTNGFPPAAALYALGLGYYNRPLPPVIPIMAKVPEQLWDYVTEPAAIQFLRMMAESKTFWIYILDSGNEESLMKNLLEQSGYFDFPRLRRVRTFSWEPKKFNVSSKEDVVVWSGRASTMKNPELAITVFSLVPKLKKEAFLPRPNPNLQRRFELVPHTVSHGGEPPDVYRNLTRSAKALLTTSHAEGFPVGFVELWCQGVLPVIWDRPWNSDLLPSDWPFRFKQPGEAAEMLIEAVGNYKKYSKLLFDWCSVRFSEPVNFPGLLLEAWEDYTLLLGDKIRLVTKRGARKSL